jgi:hypothetical protein
MDFASAKRQLESGAFMLPPAEPFDSPVHEPAFMMRLVLIHSEILSGSEKSQFDSFSSYLAGIVRRNDVAFYGSLLCDPFHCKDIDMLHFNSGAPAPYFHRPPFLHVFPVFEPEILPYSSLFLAGPLLFPDAPEASLVRRIEAERRVLAGNPFFQGGIGELITHSAFKAAESAGDGRFGVPENVRFRIERRWFDGTNMRMVTHTPHELNEQIRGQMQELSDPDVHALAMGAMRRIRVRESARAPLAERFVAELRSAARPAYKTIT